MESKFFTLTFGRRAVVVGGPACGGTELVWARLEPATTDATEVLTAALAAARVSLPTLAEGDARGYSRAAPYASTEVEAAAGAAWLVSRFGSPERACEHATRYRMSEAARAQLRAAILRSGGAGPGDRVSPT